MERNEVISFDAEIIPGKSIGGISIGEDVISVLDKLDNGQGIEESVFSNFGVKYYLYSINNGIINFTTKDDGVVLALWCGIGYKGSYKGRYYPGVTVKDIKINFKSKELYGGYLVLDNNYNIYYGLPEEFDDYDNFCQLNDEIIFEDLYVGKLR